MRVAAEFNPLAHVVAAERALFAGEFRTGAVLAGVLSAAATAAVGLLVGIRVMQRSAD
jgi:ABC-2 type transport system permease protein